MDWLKRSWVEIDLGHLEHNFRLLNALTPAATGMMAVVKADAYGHGVRDVAPLFSICGAEWFGVSNINEAVVLRDIGIAKPILVLGYTPPEHVKTLSGYNIVQTAVDEDHAKHLSFAAREAGVAIEVHLKIDTGMSRLGFDSLDTERSARAISEVCSLPALFVTGAFTHFSVADTETALAKNFTQQQYARFEKLLMRLRSLGVQFKTVHCCNSAATIFYPAFHNDLVRCGIALYGLSPTGAEIPGLPLKQAMALKSTLAMVKTLRAGECVSYGCRFTAERDMRVATVPLGYADGYPRQLTNRGVASVGGKLAPIIGTICMDQLMLDVSDVPDIAVGDVVSFFGDDSPISIDNVAGLCNTINYEIVCGMSRRLPRVYKRGSYVADAIDYTMLLHGDEPQNE